MNFIKTGRINLASTLNKKLSRTSFDGNKEKFKWPYQEYYLYGIDLKNLKI